MDGGTIAIIVLFICVVVAIVVAIILNRDDDDDDDDKKKKTPTSNTKTSSTTTSSTTTPSTTTPSTTTPSTTTPSTTTSPTPNMPTITAYYNILSFNGDQWSDMSGNENHITQIKKPLKIVDGFVVGTKNEGFIFPKNLTSGDYTMVFLGAYSGSNKGLLASNSTKYFGSDYALFGVSNSDGLARVNGETDEQFRLFKIELTRAGNTLFNHETNDRVPSGTKIEIDASDIFNENDMSPTAPLNNMVQIRVVYEDQEYTTTEHGMARNKKELKEFLERWLRMFTVTEEMGKITLTRNPQEVMVNLYRNTSNYSDFGFKEIAFFDKILSESDLSIIETQMRERQGYEFNKIRGMKSDASTTKIPMSDVDELKCLNKAEEADAKAFAINRNVGECVIYKNIEELEGWGGDAGSDYVSMCVLSTGKITEKCV